MSWRQLLSSVLSTRRHWVGEGRVYIEVRGAGGSDTEEAVGELERRLGQYPGVHRAEVNRDLGRVRVERDDDVPVEQLVRIIDEVERAYRLTAERSMPPESEHPGDHAPVVREAVTLGANVVGLGLALAGRLLRLVPLPLTVPTALTLAEATPPVRAQLERRVGLPATDLVFGVGAATTQAMAQRPVGLLVDAAYHMSLFTEARAQRRAWQRREADLGTSDATRAGLLDRLERPAPLRPGPVERYSPRAAAAAVAAYGVTLPVTRSGERALGFLLAGLPRAARLGREAFAAQLGRTASNRGALILDAQALRRLDRIDTVVIDATVILSGASVIEDVMPLDDAVSIEDLHRYAHDLVDPQAPDGKRERGGWAVVPLRRLSAPLSPEATQAADSWTRRGADVLALTWEGDPAGLVSVVPELDPLAESLVAAGRAAGRVVLAGASPGLAERLDVHQVLGAGEDPLASIVSLQETGAGVLVVAADKPSLLAAADVGIGLIGRTTAPPRGAHVCGPSLAEACLFLEAVGVARQVSRRSTQVALGSSVLAAVFAAGGPAGAAFGRAVLVTNFAAAVTMAAGTWAAVGLARRPRPVAAERTPWHAMPTDVVLDRLETSEAGLPEEEAARRRAGQADPENAGESRGLTRAWLEELANPLTPVLATGAGIAAAVGSVLDAVMIGGVLAVNAFIGGAQRLKADRSLRRLVEVTAVRVRLRRDGAETSTTADRLVPGEVVELHAGDAVPADCRVLRADGLEVDESSLTGESQLVSKTRRATAAATVADRRSMLYEGTVVAAGRGVAVVVATGERTEIGRTTRMGGDATRPTGVETRMRSLTRVTLPLSVGAGTALFAADLLRGRSPGQALAPGVSLAVAAVPEGLPFVATLAELAAARRLSARGALVRAPATVEALGRVDVLCFDKTGTLTEGRISLRRVSDGATDRSVEGLTPGLRLIVAAALRASPGGGAGRWPVAHPTDRAVVRGAQALNVGVAEGVGSWERIDDMPFEPARGYHAALGRSAQGQLLCVKGAPEVVLARCDVWRRGNESTPIDEDVRHRIEAEVDRLARGGYRVLAVAERPASNRTDLVQDRVQGLHLLGLIALADPVRRTAAAAVAQLQQAGVAVVMVTGDHPSTAESIAAELHALNGGRILTGPQLDALDDAALAEQLPDVAVFARVSPAQKARIVKGFQAIGRVVAVTGDGANDAPAIRLADVGVALGAAATPAAREAADVVVVDDRIETITDAIVEGRAMWASVRDALAMLLGGNLGEIVFTVGAGLASGGNVLNARQLLLVNLLTDMLPALAVSVRPPPGITPEVLLAEGPDNSLGAALTRDIYRRAATTAAAATAAWVLARFTGTAARANTVALVALVSAQLGQTIAVGQRSPLVLASSVASLAVLAVIVQTPGLSHVFGCRPLGPLGWTLSLGAALAATLVTLGQAQRAGQPA